MTAFAMFDIARNETVFYVDGTCVAVPGAWWPGRLVEHDGKTYRLI